MEEHLLQLGQATVPAHQVRDLPAQDPLAPEEIKFLFTSKNISYESIP